MKRIGETENFYVYAVTREDTRDGGVLDMFIYDDSDEILNQYIAAVATDEGRKDLYNEWMYDGYEKDKLEAKNDPWLMEQLKSADRPLYFVVAKEDSQILTYENAYLVPAVIGDVESIAWGSGGFYYQEDRYDITRNLFGEDHDAVWDIIYDWVDGGSIDLDAKPKRIASSPQDAKQFLKLFDRSNEYELRWIDEDSGEEKSGVYKVFNDAAAICAAATGSYAPEVDYIEYDPEEMLYFYDEAGEIDDDMCRRKAAEELPARGVVYLKNKTTGKVLYSRELVESRRRLRRGLRESERVYRREHNR